MSTLVSCDRDVDYKLQKSVFIPDPTYPDLPIYSEWGYNTFGAYYDLAPFISNGDVTSKFIITSDNTSFLLSGDYRTSGSSTMLMSFVIPDFLPSDYNDLTELHQTTLNLVNDGVIVTVSTNGFEKEAAILEGTLEFRRAQNLLVDKKQVEVILSGFFEFKAVIDGVPVTISNGRFDVGIGEFNFFVIN